MIANSQNKPIIDQMPTNDKSPDQDEFKGLKFEEAITRLEELVSEMESAEVDLDSMIKNYQSGMSLLKICQKKVEEAEFKLTKATAAEKVES